LSNKKSYFALIKNPESIITAIESGVTFPEFIEGRYQRYSPYVELFQNLINQSSSTAELLSIIRDPRNFKADVRMPLLKLFRRCVSTVIDTEKSKKIRIPTSTFTDNYGHTFKDIHLLREQFNNLPIAHKYSLTSLIGEYDDRGKQGYILTDLFFSWFENKFHQYLSIEGPRGAGRDIELSQIFTDFVGNYPCDFVIKDKRTQTVLAVGFARYDSTRGGSQSDDRTGGNNDKVMKAHKYTKNGGRFFKIVFLSDGPGLTHRDTWEEACILDGKLNDRVRVTTLKTADEKITLEWLYDGISLD